MQSRTFAQNPLVFSKMITSIAVSWCFGARPSELLFDSSVFRGAVNSIMLPADGSFHPVMASPSLVNPNFAASSTNLLHQDINQKAATPSPPLEILKSNNFSTQKNSVYENLILA